MSDKRPDPSHSNLTTPTGVPPYYGVPHLHAPHTYMHSYIHTFHRIPFPVFLFRSLPLAFPSSLSLFPGPHPPFPFSTTHLSPPLPPPPSTSPAPPPPPLSPHRHLQR